MHCGFEPYICNKLTNATHNHKSQLQKIMTSRFEIKEAEKHYLCFTAFHLETPDILRIILEYTVCLFVKEDPVPAYIQNIIPGKILEIRKAHYPWCPFTYNIPVPESYKVCKSVDWDLTLRLVKYQRSNYIYHVIHKTLDVAYGNYHTQMDFDAYDSDDPNAILPLKTRFNVKFRRRYMFFEMLDHDDYITCSLCILYSRQVYFQCSTA